MSPEADSAERALAEALRTACIDAALNAHQNALIDGLCHEGAWECAVSAMRQVNLDEICRQVLPTPPPDPTH